LTGNYKFEKQYFVGSIGQIPTLRVFEIGSKHKNEGQKINYGDNN